MIIDIINQRIKEMKEVFRLEQLQANREQQAQIVHKYQTLVKKVNKFSNTIGYLRDNFDFSLTDSVFSSVRNLIQNLKALAEDGKVSKDGVANAEKDFNTIQQLVGQEWSTYHSQKMAPIVNTLRVVQGISPEKTEACIIKISAARGWSTEGSTYSSLKHALNEADQIIDNLNMDQEIELFLTKMSLGQATISDLNEKVIAWIRSEGLQSKVKLSFN